MTGISCRHYFAIRCWGILGLGTSIEAATLAAYLRYAAFNTRRGSQWPTNCVC